MGYSIRDLENAAKNINSQLERRSQQQGAELANHLLARTSQGRGLWFIVLWPAWVLIFAFSGAFFISLLAKLGLNAPITYAGLIGGFLFARTWYSSDFTISHPFWGSVIGYFGTAIGVLLLAEKLGI